LIRSLLKVDFFDENLLSNSIEEYEKYRTLNINERESLKDFLQTLIFHVILQYFIALFQE
jgi:hypothetical protein